MNLKNQRFILIVLLAASMILHLLYGLEGMKQMEDLEGYNKRLKAQLQDKQVQIEKQKSILEIQDELIQLQDNMIQDFIIVEPEAEEISLGEFTITHYCPCKICCGKSYGITFTGTKATERRTVAVDPEVIPLGSTVIIEGQEYIAEDIGGAIKGNRLDVFMDSHQAALNAGVVQAEVYIGG